jgi:hypothetical protein
MIDLYDELKKIIEIFNREKVPYALCGGMAYSFYVEPRATVDIDFIISGDDFDKVQELLKPVGYEKMAQRMCFSDSKMVIDRLIKLMPEKGEYLLLDFILSEPLPEQSVWSDRNCIKWRGQNLWLVSRQALIYLKGMRNSDQDKVDIKRLKEKINKDEQ